MGKQSVRVYFVRHGESEANILRVISNRGQQHGLTERGRAQARALADHLADKGIVQVYSSPLLRAVQTAKTLAQACGVRYEVTDALREFDCGVAENRADEEAWGLWRSAVEAWDAHDWSYRIEGGECFHDMRDRFVPFIEAVVQRHLEPADNVALVGHGGLYFSMLPLVLTNVDAQAVKQWSMPNTGYVLAETTPTGLFCLEWCGVVVAQ